MIFIAVIFHFCNLNYEFKKAKVDTIKCTKFHEDFKYGTSYEDISFKILKKLIQNFFEKITFNKVVIYLEDGAFLYNLLALYL